MFGTFDSLSKYPPVIKPYGGRKEKATSFLFFMKIARLTPGSCQMSQCVCKAHVFTSTPSTRTPPPPAPPDRCWVLLLFVWFDETKKKRFHKARAKHTTLCLVTLNQITILNVSAMNLPKCTLKESGLSRSHMGDIWEANRTRRRIKRWMMSLERIAIMWVC